ncbi:crotonase/enoyl-CoA hydratase family protein [Pseudomaricurvus sp. HS19]|uniref:crotonase/enoyl-CoA hydratase family protein n=1 Tax=Pseudomaricurvus sp. HS19 TaxID=2692626 RepID=UPI001370B1C7|nr:crotonase/enoyl-CoA hydratase family protein [Pseudomaricurvus sp. HS19]MYM62241.1 enoyl-CoA hydratase [Pseudomaricurvus sp. HS19]
MSYNTIGYAVEDRVLTITLNRPEAMNAFTVEMCNELVDAINCASNDDAVSVIVFTGAGKAYCAGMDLSVDGNVFGLDESQNPGWQDLEERFEAPEIVDGVRDTGGRVTLALYDCNKPVIAAINGVAVGIGATMTLAMDIRLISSKGRMGFVFSKIGITPEACSTWFLPRLVGMSKALEWTYSGEILDAQTVKEGGLVTAVYEPDELLPAAYALARKIADNTSPVGVALTRQMMYRNSAAAHPVEAHKVESLMIFDISQKDGREGVQAFMEKRKPQFTQKAPSDMPALFPWWE